jgi:hypothetical protein
MRGWGKRVAAVGPVLSDQRCFHNISPVRAPISVNFGYFDFGLADNWKIYDRGGIVHAMPAQTGQESSNVGSLQLG